MCGKAFLVPSGCNLSSFSLQLHFRLTVTVVFKIRNHSPVGLESDSLQAASCVLSFSLLRSAVPVSGFCFFPLFRVFLGKKGKSGGIIRFCRIKKSAATTLRNALPIAVSVGWVVAVAVLLKTLLCVLCKLSCCPSGLTPSPSLRYLFPSLYARANIIMCLSFSSRVLRYKNMLCNTSVIQCITKKFQEIRIIFPSYVCW